MKDESSQDQQTRQGTKPAGNFSSRAYVVMVSKRFHIKKLPKF